MIDPGLQDKLVMVTGANNPSGIGAATARAFTAQGARVFLHGYRQDWKGGRKADLESFEEQESPGEAFYNRQGARPLQETLKSLGAQSSAGWEADLSDGSVVSELFDRAENAFGSVQILVNNAAYWEGDTFLPSEEELPNQLVEMWTSRPERVSAGSIERMFAVNTRAPVLLMAEFARRFIRRQANWGRIINISTAGASCFPSEISYGASKLALEGYTRSAAIELGPLGITVNAISPGPVQTGWITPELEQVLLPSIPMGRVGSPEDIADVIVFLASHQARWISGQRIFVGGGHGM
jgi:3-oxoacyl-[acyl-carrier protein] reductase